MPFVNWQTDRDRLSYPKSRDASASKNAILLKKSAKGQNFISDGAKFLISFFTSKMDGVYPGSNKNTYFSKKFWVLVPKIAPQVLAKIWAKIPLLT